MPPSHNDPMLTLVALAIMLPFLAVAAWRGILYARSGAATPMRVLWRGVLWSLPLSWNGVTVAMSNSKGVGVGVGILPSWWLMADHVNRQLMSLQQSAHVLLVGPAWLPPLLVTAVYVGIAMLVPPRKPDQTT